MRAYSRLAILVAVVWALCLLFAWLMLSPPQPLIGAKQPIPSLPSGEHLDQRDLSQSLTLLESIPLWGVERDGKPLAPPKAKEEVKPLAWRVIAVIVRPKERYALLSVEGQAAPVSVKEGDALPNGGKLLRIRPKEAAYEDAEGKPHSTQLNF